jgi:hypothetical protein
VPAIEGKASLGSGILNCLVRIRTMRERLGERVEVSNEVRARSDEQAAPINAEIAAEKLLKTAAAGCRIRLIQT